MIKPFFLWKRISDDGLLQKPRDKHIGGWYSADLNPWDGYADEKAAVEALTKYCENEWSEGDFVLVKAYRHSK